MAKYGRPAILGVKSEIDEEQARVVLRIFELSASGYSLAQIAKTLNAEAVPSPRLAKGRKFQAWCTSSIREMLYNERYRGVQVWNRTKKERNPETGRKVSRPRAESEWKRVEVPEWRIVPEELWNRVHSNLADRKRRFAANGASGISKAYVTKYLFSGLMVCGLCGAKLTIVTGDGLRAAKKYGCPNHRYRGICTNKMMMRLDRIEEALIQHLDEKLLTPETANLISVRFEKALLKRLADIESQNQRGSARISELQSDRQQLASEAERIVDAISASGHSDILLRRLAEIERKLADLDDAIRPKSSPSIQAQAEDAREFVMRSLMDMRSLLYTDVQAAKAKLSQHVGVLTFTPFENENGRGYNVSGDWNLLPDGQCVVWMVARDGIEPPTPAFSELCF
jgi:site-specific DNA recombinase